MGPETFREDGREDSVNEKAIEEKLEVGDHDETFFDEDESRSGGERINPATGERYNNSPRVSGADEELDEREFEEGKTEDLMGEIEDDDDDAARWLREHGSSGTKG